MAEITHYFLKIDWRKSPSLFELSPLEMYIFEYCLGQGAKNNMGYFCAHRGGIASFLKLMSDEEKIICNNFFEKYPDLIKFYPENHLIWVKNIYHFIDFGLSGSLEKTFKKKNKDTGIVDRWVGKNMTTYSALNGFVDKIKKTIRKDEEIKSHPFVKDWLNHHKNLLKIINEDVKDLKGNTRNLDNLLKLIE